MPKNKSVIGYLIKIKFKNQLKELVHKPARLVYLIVMAALLGFVIFAGEVSGTSLFRDIRQFGAIVFALYFVMLGLVGYSGFSNGGNFFRMSDVNLLFPAPIKQQTILFYGIVQQLGTALLMGFFILFQYSWARNIYGVTPAQLLLVVVLYAVCVMSAQLISMISYSFTAGSDRKKKLGKVIFLAVFAVIIGIVLAKTYFDGDISLEALAVNGYEIGRFFPIAGWLAGGIIELISGNFAAGAGFIVATLAASGAMVYLFMRSTPDYYEDVMVSAEKMQSILAAQSDGLQKEATPQNVKVGKQGLGGGAGASAFFYKHMLENRRSKAGYIGINSLIFIIVCLVYSFIMKAAMDGEGASAGLIAALAFSTYMQLFSSGFGRLPMELTKPFIYLVPEPAESKLFQCLREGVIRYLIDAFLMTVGLVLIFELNLVSGLIIFLFRFTCSALFMAANLLHSRIFGMKKSKGMYMMFFFLVGLLLMAPGIAAGIFAVIATSLGVEAFALAMAVVNVAVTAIVLVICRGMLNNAECNA